jgi:hypothetical protein
MPCVVQLVLQVELAGCLDASSQVQFRGCHDACCTTAMTRVVQQLAIRLIKSPFAALDTYIPVYDDLQQSISTYTNS